MENFHKALMVLKIIVGKMRNEVEQGCKKYLYNVL